MIIKHESRISRKRLHFSSVVPAKNIARAKTFPVITNSLTDHDVCIFQINEIDMTSYTDLSLPVS